MTPQAYALTFGKSIGFKEARRVARERHMELLKEFTHKVGRVDGAGFAHYLNRKDYERLLAFWSAVRKALS